jgi:lipopolysaccharide export system protein LptA
MPISAGLPIRSFLLVTLFCLSVLHGPGPLRAQSLSTIGGGDGPVTVEAENGIEWLRDARQYIAHGNARATQGEVTVFADRLIASYREAADGSTEIFQLEADGNVRIASPAQTAYGDRAAYDLDSQRMRLTGQDLRLVSAADTVTARDHIDYFQQEKMAVAVGDAVAKRDDRTIRADTLTARFAEDKDGTQQLTRVDADGNVVVTTPNEIARSRQAVYTVATETAVLSGDVKITQGKNQLNGQRAEVNLRTGVSRLLAGTGGDGRVKGIFVPQEGSSLPGRKTQ